MSAEPFERYVGGKCLFESLDKLLKEPVLVEQVFRLLIVLLRFVEQFGSDRWHNQVSF